MSYLSMVQIDGKTNSQIPIKQFCKESETPKKNEDWYEPKLIYAAFVLRIVNIGFFRQVIYLDFRVFNMLFASSTHGVKVNSNMH